MSSQTCAICQGTITPREEVQRLVSDIIVHTDCYFEEWGKEIDENPIGHPRQHKSSVGEK